MKRKRRVEITLTTERTVSIKSSREIVVLCIRCENHVHWATPERAALLTALSASEVRDNRFTIQTSAPGVKVSRQVTGIRQDARTNRNRIPVEEKESERERSSHGRNKTAQRSISAGAQRTEIKSDNQKSLEAHLSHNDDAAQIDLRLIFIQY